MPLPTEPIGSLPRSPDLLKAIQAHAAGKLSYGQLDARYDAAVRDTIHMLEQLGSPVVVDGEQRKSSFATYPLTGLTNLAPHGVVIPFADKHTRQLPLLTEGPFRYGERASRYLRAAKKHTHAPIKQAVISASALSLLYPSDPLPNYPREQFIADLINEAEADIRTCLRGGAYKVQIDFTEGRLALKLDPSGGLLRSFVDLNNQVLERFNAAERACIGVHTCPGGDQHSTHSADVDYAGLLPELFRLQVGNFYVQLASEKDPQRILGLLAKYAKGPRTIFVGVTCPINPEVESPEQVRDRLLVAAKYIDPSHLGSTDDCGFAPFCDDVSTSRETAFAKIRARLDGTVMAAKVLGV